MTELRVVSTDASAELLGTIKLDDDGTVTYSGAGGGLFVTLQRKMRGASDAAVFEYLRERGWCNGPAQLVTA